MRTSNYIQFYNENALRNYPVAECATTVSDQGTVLPTDIIIDMAVTVPSSRTQVRVSSVRITPNLVTVAVSDDLGGLLVGTYLASTLQAYTAYPMTAVADNVSGWVTFGPHSAKGVEDYRFATAAQSALEPRALRLVDAPPVTSLYRYGGYSTVQLSGIVKLEEGSGITLTAHGSNTIMVSLAADLAATLAGKPNLSATADSCGAPPIRRINGVPADANGTITLEFR